MSSYRVLLFIFENAAKGMTFCRPACLSSPVLPTGAPRTSDLEESRAAAYNQPALLAATVGFTAYTILSHRQAQPSSHCYISHCLGLLMPLLPGNQWLCCLTQSL